ncbi:hypothetical protein MVEN_01668500 [Mycena venus]|uniref:Uncharacterized protein n=1 Tax=Mycena venus TaxID=2733690 RepID=A0A8H7CP78_9AGAR|nr:hypothetical protein MVEN_01668500 [Mycena venus]
MCLFLLRAPAERMHFCQLFRRLFFCKTRTSNGSALPMSMHSTISVRAASDVLKSTLQTCSGNNSTSSGAVLATSITVLLAITERIEQTGLNVPSFAKLAERIASLTPIVCEIAGRNPSEGQTLVTALRRELESLTKDLEMAASSQNRLDQFFINTDNAVCLESHNIRLTELTARATAIMIPGALASIRKLEASASCYDESSSKALVVLGDVRGGLGGAGENARNGGEGGEGEAPKLAIGPDERYEVGNIFGGTGGTGGVGFEVGGKGGTGKGPVIGSTAGRRVNH